MAQIKISDLAAVAAVADGDEFELETGGAAKKATLAQIRTQVFAGVAGGLTIIGGLDSGDDLTLQSTAHATKGSIFFGAAQNSAYDEVNDRLGIGIVSMDGTLHVHTASAGTVTAISSADDLVVEHDDAGGISILVPDTKISKIVWGAPSDNQGAFIQWRHNVQQMQIGTSKAAAYIQFKTANAVDAMKMDSTKNLLIGGTVTPTSSVGNLALFNGTIPTDGPTNGVVLYSKDVSSSAELHTMDEAANETLLSPHGFGLYHPDPNDPFPWGYESNNAFLGKRVSADISGALRELEVLSGKTFLHYEDIPKRDWATEKAKSALVQREADIETKMEEEVEVLAEEGLEIIAVQEYQDGPDETHYILEDGVVVTKTRKSRILVDTDKSLTRTKAGVRFDEGSGKLYRQLTREEAKAAVLVETLKPPPQWMIDRGVAGTISGAPE